jgi:serine/threonine protein kinase
MNHLIKGLEEAQTQGICHRDVKPQNILLSNIGGNICFKFADFSEGKFINPNEAF